MADDMDSFHPAIIAADTANMQAGSQTSLLDSAAMLGTTAVISGLSSIYNTGASLLGAEKIDVAKVLTDNDEHLGQFYQQNKELADLSGFVATSLIPGGLAVKGLQLAKAGTALGPFSRALGFASSKTDFFVKQGLEKMAVDGGTVFQLINSNKLAAMAWETADQIQNVAAFETAVALTMNQSPLLEKDSLGDMAQHIATTSIAFGGIGGAIESIAINGIFRAGQKTISAATRDYDTIRYVQGNIPLGDKAYGIYASMLDLPEVGRNIEFTYRLAGKDNKLELPTKDALERAVSSTQRRATDDFRATLNQIAQGDELLGQQFASSLLAKLDAAKANGAGKDQLLDLLEDHLLSVGKILPINPETAAKGTEGLFYLAEKIDPKVLPTIKTADDLMLAVKNRAPAGADVSKFPYEQVGPNSEVRMAMVGTSSDAKGNLPRFATASDAFDSGVDAVVLPNGTFRINPKSPRFIQRDDPILQPRGYYNVRTGSFSDVAFATVADIASSTKRLAVTGPDMVVSGGRHWKQEGSLNVDFSLAKMDTMDASARYVWAQQLSVIPAKISESDLPLLERIYQDGSVTHGDVVIRFADGTEKAVSDIGDFGNFLKGQKLGMLRGFFESGKTEDVVAIATKLNVDPQWVSKAVETNFQAPALDISSIKLTDSLKPQNMEVRWDFARTQEISNKLTGKKADTKPIGFIQTLPDAAGHVIYGQLGWQYRVKVAKDQYEAAFTAVMGAKNAAKFLELTPEIAARIADSAGAGSGLLKFSNADYGDQLRLWAQYSGQQVNILGREAANATLDVLQPIMLAIKDKPEAAAELGVLTTALRRTPDKFVHSIENPKTLLNKDAAVFDKELGGYKLDEVKAGDLTAVGRRVKFDIQSDDVAEFVAASTAANAGRVDKMKVLMTARGWNYNYDPHVVYAPAVDTARYPYFAFVRAKPELLNGTSDVSMITARTEESLKDLVAKVPDNYEVVFKQDTEKFHKVKGDYEYALTLKEPTIDATLQKRGVLGDFFPEVRAENVLDDYISWHQRAEIGLVRKAVETRYAQVFEELRAIGRQYEELGTSKFGGILKKFRSQIENPFEDYLKTALDISKRSEYTLLHDANEFAEALGRKAYGIFEGNQQKAMSGSVSWEEANKISERYGIAGPYTDAAGLYKANAPEERSIVKEFVGKANMLLVNLTLRLDFANSIVNVISTPILLSTELASIKNLVANDSELAGKLNQLRSLQVPGSSVSVPSTVPLIATAMKNFWSADKAELLARYKSVGAVKDLLSQYHEMVDWLSYKPYKKLSELQERGNKAVDIAAKFTGSEWAEQFTRFVSADVMRQITEPIVKAGKMSVAEQDAYISVFVNRVQGNYLNSQRPIAFQGVLGSAVSLFQTYQFNMLQQLFRHIENRDTRALATLGGMQAGLYGLNGIPFFEAVNTHLIGNSNINPEHHDLYSTAPQVMGKQLGDWMMYGTASAFPLFSSAAPSLYTRGDINPRHISIIPVNPLDVPAVDGSIRFVSNLINTGQKLVQGADVSTTLLNGLEHNSINRPLAGIAQVFQGNATTSKGGLISASNDFFSIATLSRVAGAKPMDESLALNTMFRINAYQAADAARIETLGEVVKGKLRAGKVPSMEELQSFQLEYAKAGGRVENYSKSLQRWSKDANVSVVNQLIAQHRTSYSKRLLEVMGGNTISDYRSLQAPVSESSADSGNPADSGNVPAGS